MYQGSLNQKIPRFLGQNVCPVGVTIVGTLSGFQDFFLQPIVKDRPNSHDFLFDPYNSVILPNSPFSQMLPVETNIKEAYQAGTDDEQNFIQNLSLFLCTFLKEHALLVEKKIELHKLLMEVSHV